MKKELEDLVVNNMGLAYDVLSKYFFRVQNFYEYEDALQICFEGLINAANTFDDTRGVSFSTYAHTVIKRHLFRQPILESKRRAGAFITSVTSLDDLLQDEENTLIDIVSIDYSLEDDYVGSSEVELLYRYIDRLKEPQRNIMLLRCKNKTFKEIANDLEMTESVVQQIYKKALNILRCMYKKDGRDI